MKIILCIPTLNACSTAHIFISALERQISKPDVVLVIDSSSDDGSVETFRRAGAKIKEIPRSLFNHGATREMARKCVPADIVIFMTQDAIPVDNLLIERLIEPIINGRASISYARQISHKGADVFEAFPRLFNYPAESNIRGIEDVDKYGVYTFFCSDSCAAYLNSALDEIGGFRPTLTSEDYFAVARLIQRGHKVAYVAEAVVEHSHSYSLWDEFRRYFDTGYVRAENPWVQNLVGHAEGRGKEYFFKFVKQLLITKPWLIPYAIINTFVKLLGYRVGFWSFNAPKCWKKMLSGQRYYWDSNYYENDKK